MIAVGAACSVVPDLDVFFFRFFDRESMFGHRGITHSILFAALLGGAVAYELGRRTSAVSPWKLWLYLFAATASHGLFDALTNGGSGVAFFAPFSSSRYFFPFRPILVSPIGIDRFLTERGATVLASEAAWVWVPSLGLALLATIACRWLARPSRRNRKSTSSTAEPPRWS